MYHAHAYTTSREKVISGAFASTMHLLFIALLVFGVSWQKKSEPQVNIVDLWSPPADAPKAAAAPPPAPEPPKPVPKPEPKPEPKPPVKPEVRVKPEPPKPVAKPEAAKPDIALKEKEKIEKQRRAEEEKQKAAKKREEETQAAQKSQQAEAQRAANEQAEAQRAMAAQAAAASKSMVAKYTKGISDKIKRFIVQPANLKGNEEAEFDIVVLPDGNVLAAKLRKSSGNPAYDNAVERAINRAQPLPLPTEPALLKDFRELNLKFKAQE
jgi:colicin import membrane protein